jgi:predicted nucleotidyltransferase
VKSEKLAYKKLDDLGEVRRIVLEYLRHWRVRIYLFGSQARGDVTDHSDIDIALLPEGPVPVDWLSGLRERLEESLVLRHVDVVDLRTAGPELSQKIREEGVAWSD